MHASLSIAPKPVKMKQFDNFLAITFFCLNGQLLMIDPNDLSLFGAVVSFVVLLLRNFRRIVLTLYDFYLLATADNRKELKQMLQDWRTNALKDSKTKENDDDNDN